MGLFGQVMESYGFCTRPRASLGWGKPTIVARLCQGGSPGGGGCCCGWVKWGRRMVCRTGPVPRRSGRRWRRTCVGLGRMRAPSACCAGCPAARHAATACPSAAGLRLCEFEPSSAQGGTLLFKGATPHGVLSRTLREVFFHFETLASLGVVGVGPGELTGGAACAAGRGRLVAPEPDGLRRPHAHDAEATQERKQHRTQSPFVSGCRADGRRRSGPARRRRCRPRWPRAFRP